MEDSRKNHVLYASEFEKKVLNFISSYLSKEEKILFEPPITGIHQKIRFDAYLPQGCKAFNWAPNTAIEVKIRLMPDTVYRYVNLIKENNLNEDNGELSNSFITNIVIICDSLPDEAAINEYLGPYSESIRVTSFNSLQRTIDKTVAKSSAKSIQMTEEDQQKKYLDEIAYSMANGQVTLFLGAGVSMSANLPSWNTLMRDVLSNINGKPFNHLGGANTESIVESCGFSSIVAGRYAFDGFNDMDAFSERIHNSLYKDVKPSLLIDKICSLINEHKINQVITYNYDDLIETKLDSIPFKNYYSVYGKNREISNAIRIYHVHGMIPERAGIKSTPILSEKDYHQLYRDSHNWSNVVQLFALNNTTCVFIGLSMNDPNLRRLLDFSVSDEGLAKTDKDIIPHYVFLQKLKLKGEESKRANKEHWKEQERMMNQLGLNVIWFESFDELPRLLCQTEQRAKVYELRTLAYNCFNENDFQKTIEYLDEILSLDSSDASAYYNRGNAKSKLKDYEGAIQDFDRAIELKRDYAEAFNNKGIAKSKFGNKEGAIQDYDKAIELRPDDVIPYYNRGNAKYDLGDIEGAIQDFDKAIELEPDKAKHYNSRAALYRKMADQEEDETIKKEMVKLAEQDEAKSKELRSK